MNSVEVVEICNVDAKFAVKSDVRNFKSTSIDKSTVATQSVYFCITIGLCRLSYNYAYYILCIRTLYRWLRESDVY